MDAKANAKVSVKDDNFSWGEMSDLVHAIRDERVVILATIIKLQRTDKKLQELEERLQTIILKHDGTDTTIHN